MPRPRLHKSSIVIALIAAFIAILIEVPGRVDYGTTRIRPTGLEVRTTFDHGWPWVFLRRTTLGYYADDEVPQERRLKLHPNAFIPLGFDERTDLPMWSVPWLSAENWLFWEADMSGAPPRWEFDPIALSCNLAIALLLFAGVVAAWEFWRRRREGPLSFRFGLRAVLLCIAAAAAVLGWLTFLEREHGRETALIKRVSERSGPMEATWYDNDYVCVAPLWLRSLVGVRFFPEYFCRASTVELKPERGEKTDLMCAEIAQLDYVTKVSIDGDPRQRFRFSALRNLERIKTIEIWRPTILDEPALNELAQLKQLRKIVIERIDEIAPAVIARLEAELPNCKIIGYSDDW
ncbi:MAG TPA: hypothetical protein VGK58_11710 [Lacipirellulaceae bacterium]